MNRSDIAGKRKRIVYSTLLQGILWLAALLHIYPILLVLMSALKTTEELGKNPAGFPRHISFEFFSIAFDSLHYFRSLFNTAFIAAASVTVLIVITSAAAYAITRRANRFYNKLYVFFMAGLIVPFQMTMLPLYKLIRSLGLMSTYQGIIFIYLALLAPFSIFLFTGFIKTVPIELEESARIDGCGMYHIFLAIVFPLLRPAAATIAVLDIISIWNDFLMPMLFLQKNQVRTLIVQVSSFFGQYFSDWSSIFASICLIVYPMVLIYLLTQNVIIKGITAGAVKG
jgi:raffinose/stachyose/melibiose transport system permease protein